jgi:hypothetical protein
MKVTDNISSDRVGVDEAYERFFDGFYNLGRPGDLFQRTVVVSPPRREPVKPMRRPRGRWNMKAGRKAKR